MSSDPEDMQLDRLLCFNIYATHRAFGRFYQAAFSETGMTYPKFVTLTALAEHGAMTVTELSQRAGVEPNTLSPLLKKMASFGVLSRTRAEDDERRVVIDMTDLGRSLLARAQQTVAQGYHDLGLDPSDVARVIGILETAREKLETAEPPKLDISDVMKGTGQ